MKLKWNLGLLYTVLSLFILFSCGCVERKLTINTNPQGAAVFLNDEEIGSTPVTVEFSWYGDYKIRAEKAGFEILNTHRPLKAPLHDKFPFDFFYEIIWPGQIIDEYEWSFDLQPYQAPDRDELIKQAESMKGKAKEDLKSSMPADSN